MWNKDFWRPRLTAIRANIADRKEKESRIYQALDALTADCRTAFAYVSMNSEVDTRKFLARRDKRLLVPHTAGGEMYPALYDGGALNPDKLGNTAYANRYDGPIDCVIVPMLGFNEDRYRIGYGGGYYDRYLKNGLLSIGLAFDECLCAFEPQAHDVPLDVIITPDRVYRRQ